MGNLFSKSSPPSPLLEKPWRDVNLGDKQGALQRVNNYRPPSDRLCLRILLHGPVGAGKSSFINSVTSVLKGSISNPAFAANMSDSFTNKLTTHEIPNGDGVYPFVLNDMMGLKGASSRRYRRNHVKRLLKGHVRDGYTFNPERSISKEDQCYNKAPTLNDRVHVLVFVIDANTQGIMSREVVETISDIRDEAYDLGIPQVAIFTKIDATCPDIKKDLANVYRSVLLKDKVDKLSTGVGIPVNCIFPVMNYHSELSLSQDTDTLILNTLTHIISAGNEFLTKETRN